MKQILIAASLGAGMCFVALAWAAAFMLIAFQFQNVGTALYLGLSTAGLGLVAYKFR